MGLIKYFIYLDERFWQQAYQLSDTSTVAPFISDLVRAAFDCGKTVNLMRTIAPQVPDNMENYNSRETVLIVGVDYFCHCYVLT
jgi:hypothetical protein